MHAMSQLATSLYLTGMDNLNNVALFAAKGEAGGGTNTGWNIFNMFDSMRADGEAIVGYFAGFLAVVLFGFAAFKFAQAVMTQQGRGANVGIALAALIVGGFLGFDAYNRIAGISKGAGTTIENWGTGTTNNK